MKAQGIEGELTLSSLRAFIKKYKRAKVDLNPAMRPIVAVPFRSRSPPIDAKSWQHRVRVRNFSVTIPWVYSLAAGGGGRLHT